MGMPIQRLMRFLCKRSALVLMIGLLVPVTVTGWAPRCFAANAPEKDYLAVFDRGQTGQPFAILEKPKGVLIGAGTPVEIHAFGLHIAAVDGPQLAEALRRLPALDRAESSLLPPGVRVYADSRYVTVAYAAAAHTYKIEFTSPADLTGTGRGGNGGSTGAAGGGGGM